MKFGRLVLLALLLPATWSAAAEPSAMELLKTGKVDDALRVLNVQVSSNPQNARAYAELCRVYSSLDDLDNAILNCQKATQIEPNIGEYHLWLGRVYGDKADKAGIFGGFGWAKKTIAEFERAVQLAPNNLQARSDLTEFYREAPGMVGGDMAKAHRVVDETARIDSPTASVLRAQFALKDKDYATALAETQLAVKQSGGSAQYILEVARVYSKQKKWSDFEKYVRDAMESRKKRPLDQFNAAEMLISTGRDLNGAIALMREYLSGPMDEDAPAFRAHFLIGRAYEKKGNKSEAAREYQSSLDQARTFRPAQDALRRVRG